MEYVEPITYKAESHRSGCTTQKIYGKNLDRLRARAIKLLTSWEPGFGCTHPKQVLLFRSVRTLSGNQTLWELIQTLPYASLPEDQLEWRKKKGPLDTKQ